MRAVRGANGGPMPILLSLVLSASLALPADRVGRPRASPIPPPYISALLTSSFRHVRALTPGLTEVLIQGLVRSPPFADLVAALARSDVIVNIVASQNLRPSIVARILLVPSPKQVRFLRMQVRTEGFFVDLIVRVGHELRHALEIAAASDVRDDRGLVRFYERIGTRMTDGHEYETADARETARQVRRDLMR